MQKEFDKVTMDKEEDISHIRDHNQKLLLQIKKAKDGKQYNQNIEEKNQDLQKKLLEIIEQNGQPNNHKQDIIDQTQKIKMMRNHKKKLSRSLRMIKIHWKKKQKQI